MKALFIFSILLLTTLCVQEEEHVLVLDDANFDSEVANHEFLLVEFYAPWCGHCRSLAPEYSKAAEILKGLEPLVRLAKVDATVSTGLKDKHNIEGFPTLKFSTNGTFVDYHGGRTASEIVAWVKRRTGSPTIELTTVEDVQKLKNSEDVSIVYFGLNDTVKGDMIRTFSKDFDGAVFYTVSNANLWEKLNATEGTVVLFKNFEEGRNDLTGEFDIPALKEFITSHSVPLVSSFNERVAEAIFGNFHPAIFLYRSAENPEHFKIEEKIRKIAAPFKGKLIFVITDIKDEMEKRLADYYGIKEGSLPQLRIANVKNEDEIINYNFNDNGKVFTNTTDTEIINFIKEFLAGNLTPSVKSEDVPKEQNEAVYNLVGKTFPDLVTNSNKNAFVEFYAPWCGHCKNLAPVWEQLAKNFQVVETLMIAKIDGTANEVAGVQAEGYPTIRFYPNGDKLNPEEYNGERDIQSLTDYLNNKLGTNVSSGAEVNSTNTETTTNEAPKDDL